MKTYLVKSFVIGEVVEWQLCFTDYKASEGWNMLYIFKGKEKGFDVKGQENGDCFKFKISINPKDNLKPSCYWWQLTVSKGDNGYLLDEGEIEVKPNFALLDNYDGRSHVEKVLDALEACLLGKASRDQMGYSISGRSLSRMNPAELLQWRDKYKAELVFMRRKSGLLRDQNIKVRF